MQVERQTVFQNVFQNAKVQKSINSKEGPYQDRPLLCPFRLSPLLTCSRSALAFLKIQGPKSKNIESVIFLQP